MSLRPLRLVVKGFEIRTFATNEPMLAARDRTELLDHFILGRLTPLVSEVFDLESTARALATVGGRRSVGKVLVQVSGRTDPAQ